jgi:hypothetical protein
MQHFQGLGILFYDTMLLQAANAGTLLPGLQDFKLQLQEKKKQVELARDAASIGVTNDKVTATNYNQTAFNPTLQRTQ